MVAPTYPYVLISLTAVDADSPLDETLMTQIVKNQIHVEEWLGDGYTAAKDHDHDGINSKVAIGLQIQVGDIFLAEHAAQAQESGTTPTKLFEIILSRGGELRISLDIKNSASAGTAHAQIYRNGGAVGTQRNESSTSPSTISEDIAGWTVGDLVQLYAWHTGAAAAAQVLNFIIFTDDGGYQTEDNTTYMVADP